MEGSIKKEKEPIDMNNSAVIAGTRDVDEGIRGINSNGKTHN